jgi:hypothetical protein
MSHINQIHIAGTTTYHNLQLVREWISDRLEMIVTFQEAAIEAQLELDKVAAIWLIAPVRAVKTIYIDGFSLQHSHDGLVYGGTNEPALLESKLRLVIDKDGATIWQDEQDHHTFVIELLEKPYYEEETDE